MIEAALTDDKIWDTCVVGTGPVGMALALEMERLGREVLLLEAGGAEVSAARAAESHAEIADATRHAPMEIAVVRALGGTSWTWGGRCVAYDDVDWMPREFVADAKWPLDHDAVRPYYARAAELLLCGSDAFAAPYGRALTCGLTLDGLERWARNSRVIEAHRDHIIRSEKIRLSLNTVLTGLEFSADGASIDALLVQIPQGTRRIKAKRFVLAMGGVETTRLLLNVQRERPELFGRVDGPLGRYYMGHISGKIASIVFDDEAAADALDFKLDSSGAWVRRRLMLTADEQIKRGLLNTAFWPDNPPMYDPEHRSGVLSMVFLALAFPPMGRMLLPEAIRLAHTGEKRYPIAAHLRNAVVGAPRAAADLYRILRDRFLRKPRKPGFLVKNKGRKYALHYHAEQVPDAASRITLAETADRFGLKQARIDLRFTEQDVTSVIESHRALDLALRENKIGRLEYWHAENELREHVWAQAADGFHQAGTTRMGDDPATSVVDADLRVHSLDNLWLASSSVFVTTGQANSTLLAVAFAIRLAERLATE